MSQTPLSLAGFQVILIGRFWVIAEGRDDLVSRLDRVRTISHDFGYGVGDDMDFLLSKYTRS